MIVLILIFTIKNVSMDFWGSNRYSQILKRISKQAEGQGLEEKNGFLENESRMQHQETLQFIIPCMWSIFQKTRHIPKVRNTYSICGRSKERRVDEKSNKWGVTPLLSTARENVQGDKSQL